ncbi:MAG TPA: hypothetical protein PL143_02365 [Rhodocyclaceae bacterium]|nr:hypothetical protein [Rhodocyclaceae bacterium]
MDKVQDFVGRMVRLRAAHFRTLLARLCARGLSLDNRFLCTTINRKTGKLVCYGGDLCLLLSPEQIELV